MNGIVVGINRSSTAARAVATAAEMARALGVNLHLAMCADKSKAVELKVRSDEDYADSRSEAEQFLQDAARELDHDQVTHAVGVGSPAVMLCEEAHRLRARTIVVGKPSSPRCVSCPGLDRGRSGEERRVRRADRQHHRLSNFGRRATRQCRVGRRMVRR